MLSGTHLVSRLCPVPSRLRGWAHRRLTGSRGPCETEFMGRYIFAKRSSNKFRDEGILDLDTKAGTIHFPG